MSDRTRSVPAKTSALRRWLYAACALFIFGILAGSFLPTKWIARFGPIKTDDAYDISIFYCAARVVGQGDPYALEPLTTCEHQFFARLLDTETAPAPQPGYVLAAFAPFSHLESRRFIFIWLVALLAMAAAASGFLARLTGFPAVAICAALLLGPGFENLELGQLSMAVVLGVSAAAYCLRTARPRCATLALGLALAEPHVGLPAFLALFVLVPRSRALALLMGCVALGISLATFGTSVTWEYFTRNLPLQAIAEARNTEQYSATVIAAFFGASDRLAIRIGEVQYALFAIASIALAKRLMDRDRDPTFIVALPAAAAVIGGPFIHFSELLALWPATLLLASRAKGNARAAAIGVIALLAFPWRANVALPTRALIDLGYAIVAFGMVSPMWPSRRVLAAFGVTAFGCITGYALQHVPLRPLVTIPAPLSVLAREAPWGSGLAAMPWAIHMRTEHNVLTAYELAIKAPTYLTIVLLIAVALAAAGLRRAGRRRTSSAGVGMAA